MIRLLRSTDARSYICPVLETALLPSATLTELYRFALLLTGRPQVAEKVMTETLREVEGQLAQFRTEDHRRVWLAGRIRQRCLRDHTSDKGAVVAPRLLREEDSSADRGGSTVLEIEAFIVARHFHTLPEPERSALALFYLDLFTPGELAGFLKMEVEQLAETLATARERLQEALRPDLTRS